MAFAPSWLFVRQKGAKSQKDRYLQSSERELSTFSALPKFDCAENAARFEREAYCFYKPLPQNKLGMIVSTGIAPMLVVPSLIFILITVAFSVISSIVQIRISKKHKTFLF